MRPTTDLIGRPYAFTQLPLLSAPDFVAQLRDRGVLISPSYLEALHHRRILLPLLRASRDGRWVRAQIRRDGDSAYHLAGFGPKWHFGSSTMFGYPTGEIQAHDPTLERFVPWSRGSIEHREIRYVLSAPLYSRHQLIMVPLIRQTLPFMSWARGGLPGGGPRLDAPRPQLARWRASAQHLRDVVIAASTLEATYWPDIVQRFRFGVLDDAERYREWSNAEPLTATLEWLGVSATWLFEQAGELLSMADSFDPLGRWREVVRCAAPDTWDWLRGEARNAIDLRLVAELLLAYHDELIEEDPPTVTAQTSSLRRKPVTSRLGHRKPRRLDPVLTEFGISPHPRLIVVLEGATEMRFWRHLVSYRGIPADEEVISLVDAHGVGTDLGLLLAHNAPRGALAQPEGYLLLTRPLTRFLFVSDPERPMATPARREARRQAWLDRLLETFEAQHRTHAVRDQLESIIQVETWNTKGESFEFAHFTDRQIAEAFHTLPGRHTRKAIDELAGVVASLRTQRANLETINQRVSKVELADALWPVMERRLDRAHLRGNVSRAPIVRILDLALELAFELPRRGIAITLGAAAPSPRAD